MSNSRGISASVYKALYGKSAGRCNICEEEVFEYGNSQGVIIHKGQMAHQMPYSNNNNAPRAKARKIDDENTDNSYENLILLCANDHLKVDQDTEYYTVEKLKKIKNRFEKKINDKLADIQNTDSIMLENIKNFINFQAICSMLDNPHLIPYDIIGIHDLHTLAELNSPTYYPFKDHELTNLYQDIICKFKPLSNFLLNFYEYIIPNFFTPIDSIKGEKNLTTEQFNEISNILISLRDSIYNWLEYTK